MSFRLPLIDDELLSRAVPTAKVELTEADLRLIALALSHSAVTPPLGWTHAADKQNFDFTARRMARVAQDLRKEARNHKNGAAPIAVGPRHGSKELSR